MGLGPVQCSRYSESLQAGRSDVRTSVWATDLLFSTPVQAGPGAAQSPLQSEPELFPGVIRPERDADHRPHLVSRLKIGRDTLLLFPCVFMACYRVKFALLQDGSAILACKTVEATSENSWLLMKTAISGVDSRVVAWVREFLLGRTQKVILRLQLSEEARVRSGVPQGSVLGPLLFLAYVNNIWKITVSTIRLFADDCVIYKKLLIMRTSKSCRNIWTGWGNGRQKINPSKCKAVPFRMVRLRTRKIIH
jgi:hypothetical protein